MTVVDYTDTWTVPVERDGWVQAHHTIREDLKDIERMGLAYIGQLKAGKPLSKSQISAAKRFWGVYYVFLAHHHATEDSIVLPYLQKHTDTPQKVCADHELIIGATKKLNSMLNQSLDNPDGVAASELEAFVKELKETTPLLLAHLDEEEEYLIPLFRKHVSPKEAKKIVDQIVRSLPFAATSNFIDKMDSSHGFADFARQEGIPFFVVWILKWQHRRYVRKVKNPFEKAIQEATAASKV